MSKYIPRLLEDYNKRIKPSLSKDLGISNQMRVPKILKISFFYLSIREEYFSQKESGDLRLPFRKDKLTERGYPPGSIYINVRSKLSPGIVSRYAGVDGKPERITDPGQIYSGCIVRASLNAFAYDRAGNRGISLGLNNIQKLADGERLDGRLKAEDDFEALDHRTSELDEMLS